jgi:truncated hemoglobin YjbI
MLHAPELSYLRDGENGLLLDGTRAENLARIKALLSSPAIYAQMCREAFATAKELSVERWLEQMAGALTSLRLRLATVSEDESPDGRRI